MQRVIIIGSPGAGKSTFARALQARTRLPLFYLDMLYHLPDRSTVSRPEFDRRLNEILCQERWIIDGNYSRTIPLRLAACDTVFLLDFPTEVCLAGAAARVGTHRPDMPWVENEFDPEFRQFIEHFREERLPRIDALLAQYENELEIHRFRSRAEAEAYLETLDRALYYA